MKSYPIDPRTSVQIEKSYGIAKQEVDDDQRDRFAAFSEHARELALKIAEHTPPGREQSLALTHLENAVLWVAKAIALEP